eukprot:461667_1
MSNVFSIVTCYICILSASKPFRDINDHQGFIEGFVTHGVNNFNGDAIVDLVSDGYGYIFQNAPYEQQVLNTNGDTAILPTETTERDALLSTGSDFTDWFIQNGFDVTADPAVFNIPYLSIGVTTAASQSIDDRYQLFSFDDAADNDPSDVYPKTYYPNGAITEPLLGDWEKASGLIEVECDTKTTSAMVHVTVCGMLPSSVYTVWEVGVTNPGPEETIYTHPAGGVGNIIRTNLNGFGELEFKMPWCPLRECIPQQSKDCQIYFSVFHHSDYIVYGGDFAGVIWKPFSYPAGVVGSNHLWFPLKGTFLQQPVNRFRRHKCNKKNKRNKRRDWYKKNRKNKKNKRRNRYSDSDSDSDSGRW